VRLGVVGELEKLFNVKADVSFKVSIAAAATLTMGDAQFFPVGSRGLETHHIFSYSP